MKRLLFAIIALAVLVATLLYAHGLATQLAREEQQRMEIWAEATRQLILAGPDDDIDFVTTIIEGNTTIPVYMADRDGKYLLSRNVHLPKRLQQEGQEEAAVAWYQADLDKIRESSQPIEVRLSRGNIQYIYYDESDILKQLHWFPLIEAFLAIAFLIIAFITLRAQHRAEENHLWVGLCKETAHQLGTPISSLAGWNALLKETYPNDPSFVEVDHDIQRLTTITDRFSKIGSRPTLTPSALVPVLEDTIIYMRARVGTKVRIDFSCDESLRGVQAALNAPLFAWVIENLIRNAVDAMNGTGTITIRLASSPASLFSSSSFIHIDVSDTGHGIPRHQWKRIFRPGFSTKSRGWGLGLSLSRRIVTDYHHGRLFVLQSSLPSSRTSSPPSSRTSSLPSSRTPSLPSSRPSSLQSSLSSSHPSEASLPSGTTFRIILPPIHPSI